MTTPSPAAIMALVRVLASMPRRFSPVNSNAKKTAYTQKGSGRIFRAASLHQITQMIGFIT